MTQASGLESSILEEASKKGKEGSSRPGPELVTLLVKEDSTQGRAEHRGG